MKLCLSRLSMSLAPRLAASCLALSTPLAWAVAQPSPERVAECVAAMTTKAEPLAEQAKAGNAQADAQLVPLVTSAFTFIGLAYKQDVSKEKADKLLDQAKVDQKSMPDKALHTLQDTCQKEGDALYADLNFVEKTIVKQAAKRRIEKLKRPKKAKVAASAPSASTPATAAP